MRENDDEKRTLPIEGARLVKLRFCGNGKDSEATIEIEGAPEMVIPLSNAAMDVDFSGVATVTTSGWGDTAVVIEMVPVPGLPLTIDEAAVWFPGSEDEWNDGLRGYRDTGRWTLSWCVALRLRLASACR